MGRLIGVRPSSLAVMRARGGSVDPTLPLFVIDFENNQLNGLVGSEGAYTFDPTKVVPGAGSGFLGAASLGNRFAITGAAKAEILKGAVVVFDCTVATNDMAAMFITNAGPQQCNLRFFRGAAQQGIQDDYAGAVDVAAREFGGVMGRVKIAFRTNFSNLGWALHSNASPGYGVKHEGFVEDSPDVGLPDMVGFRMTSGPTTGILHSVKVFLSAADLLVSMDK